jgi:hypothetical protein
LAAPKFATRNVLQPPAQHLSHTAALVCSSAWPALVGDFFNRRTAMAAARLGGMWRLLLLAIVVLGWGAFDLTAADSDGAPSPSPQ